MARISVFSRAHRALRELPRFRFLQNETELPAYRQGYDSVVIGEPIGIYSNPVPTQPETILVAERGLVSIRQGAACSQSHLLTWAASKGLTPKRMPHGFA